MLRRSVAIAPDGKTALSGSDDGTIRLWDLQTGEELVSLSASRDGESTSTITPKGFFTASQRDTDMLAIVRGHGGHHHRAGSPVAVQPRSCAGGAGGRSRWRGKRAAEVMNLEKVLDAGPPPAVAIALARARQPSPAPIS